MLIDTHCHVHFGSYGSDREEVHQRMREFGVKAITVGTAMTTSKSAVEYADAFDDIWSAVGFHPDHVTNEHEDAEEGNVSDQPYDAVALELMAASSSKVVALGETGLDYHYFGEMTEDEILSAKKIQLKVFLEHAEIATRLDKALIIHSRDAAQDMLRALAEVRKKSPGLRIVQHAFNGTRQEASDLLDLGCWLGIGGIVTFKPRKETAPEDALAEIVKTIPSNKLLLETDAPWLAPTPVRGQRNEPSYVRHIADHVSRVLGLTYDEVCAMTTENARKCFNVAF